MMRTTAEHRNTRTTLEKLRCPEAYLAAPHHPLPANAPHHLHRADDSAEAVLKVPDLPCVLEHLAMTMRDNALSAAGNSDAG